jgi:hypothetical protein
MEKELFKKKHPKAYAHHGKKGWAIYTRRFGTRVTAWYKTRREAWFMIGDRGL